MAKVGMQSGGTQNGKHSRLALAAAYALESMVDGFLAELNFRKNPNLVSLDLTEAEVAKVVSDVWCGATAKR